MSRGSCVAVTVAVVLALTTGACAAHRKTSSRADRICITDFNPDTDYFRDKSKVADATNFTLSYHNSYQVLTVKQPYPNGRPESYVLVRLAPLSAALRRLAPISEKLLRGNVASALLGAARVFDSDTTAGPGWQLARRLCADERLTGTICFGKAGYRRTSCCLYYRASRGGLCGDCVLTSKPRQRRKVTS
jgi:hypothetical protein